jgi:hypothetical protein
MENEMGETYNAYREIINAYKILVGKTTVKSHLRDLGADERIIIKCILEKEGVRMWSKFTWLTVGSKDGLVWTR